MTGWLVWMVEIVGVFVARCHAASQNIRALIG
jgi:hypothetical protein